ncbi:hypothetical protein BUALT_Bualt17G0083900 [Buddleja alternifolia]|uniref:Uncharacterized protein n=1 Tax=Buddleja alternifolia TaxID=168488 RepID=A0AAV6W4Y0_9LAMI|nr:hypothetical protein BUALT_Bualt17G0083900 [Buddleja alternifolia]
MGKSTKEDKSDDIEIISIGKIYTGPWDKKYWSSSRGKDRYPYPVGYKSLRTQNGVTYKMEIFEGLKGPSFSISSTDGKSCSGDTPDIAWESFQKKGCSQIKLRHGKRFSCKINGVEFFGFKNTFVQRLLRELVANVGGTAEQSLLPSNSSRACETIDQSQCKESNPDPNMLPYLAKSHVTGKRSRNQKVVNTKRLNGTHFKQQQQEKCSQNASTSNSKQRDQSNCGRGDPSTSASANEVPGFCCSPGVLGPENLAARVENEKCLPIAERGVQLDSLDTSNHLKVEGQRELTGASDNFGFNDNLPKDQKPTGTSRNIEAQEFNNSIPEEIGEGVNVQHGTPVVTDAALCAPDTLDQAGDSSSVSSLYNHEQVHGTLKGASVHNVAMSEVLVTDSLPEDELGTSAYNTNSEKCDTDSVGQEIAKSMMTLLLPRALPLLKTFTRKKKKSAKSSKIPTQRSQEKNNMSNISNDDASIAREVAQHSDLEMQNKKARISNAGHGSTVSTSDNSDHVVPDSFDNEHQYLLPGTAIAGQVSYGLDPHAQLLVSVSAEAMGIGGNDMNIHCERQTTSVKKPKNGEDDSRSNIQPKANLTSKLQGLLELSACFVHPMPISMVQLIVKDNEVFVCVKCGYSEHNESTIFVYKALKKGEKMGCPSLIGHVPVALQFLKNALGRDILVETSLLQLTPDAQSLVLLNSIKTPYCREGKLHCACSACASDCFEKNAVKIVQLNSGYASLVTRLETNQDVCCLLVCEPCYLIAAEEGGKLKMWVMNSGWSEKKEDCYLPTFDCMFPSIVELKRIPKSAILVIGHNGFGDFGLWDIDKRILVSRFSSPGMSVLECVPSSILRWQRKGECNPEALIDQIMDATKMWFSGTSVNHFFPPDDKDVAVWLLISTVPEPDSQCYQSCELEANQIRCWRLALLVNNTVIMGSAVGQGVAAVTSAGHGIMGTRDGLVYMWELSTGMKLGNLNSVNGTRVSCITTDTSNSGALAIATSDQLQVYLPS